MIAKQISRKITNFLNSIYQRSDEDCIKIEYMIEKTLSRYFILIAVFILCKLIGNLNESIICFVAFVVMRTFAGGFHLKSAIGCVVLSTFTIISGGMLVHYVDIPDSIYILMIIADIILNDMFSPQNTDNMPITDRYKVIRKWESIIVVCISAVLFFMMPNPYGKCAVVGVTLESLTILPFLNK